MQHFCKSLLKSSIFLASKSQLSVKPFKVVQYGQQRWLAQRILKPKSISEINASRGSDVNKVTPLGWFLLLIPATTFGLGCWQVKRKVWKEQLIRELQMKSDLEPVELNEYMHKLGGLEYRKVKVRGKFLHDKEMLMGPRSLILPNEDQRQGGLFSSRDLSNGYLVITPFQLAETGDIVLINRGWVSRKHMKPEARNDGQVSDDLELTGVFRIGESRPQFTPDHKGGIFLYRDLEKMCASTGAKPIFLDAIYESSVPGGPIGGQTRVTLRNEHLSYLITWFSLSAATSYMWYRQIIKRKPF